MKKNSVNWYINGLCGGSVIRQNYERTVSLSCAAYVKCEMLLLLASRILCPAAIRLTHQLLVAAAYLGRRGLHSCAPECSVSRSQLRHQLKHHSNWGILEPLIPRATETSPQLRQQQKHHSNCDSNWNFLDRNWNILDSTATQASQQLRQQLKHPLYQLKYPRQQLRHHRNCDSN